MLSSASASPTAPPLTGEWGGSQVRLVLTETGGTLDMACASASIDSAVHPDATGKFGATGRYESFTGGPTRADVPPAMVAAQFEGRIDGDILYLVVRQQGAKAEEKFTLERGRRVKLLRCV